MLKAVRLTHKQFQKQSQNDCQVWFPEQPCKAHGRNTGNMLDRVVQGVSTRSRRHQQDLAQQRLTKVQTKKPKCFLIHDQCSFIWLALLSTDGRIAYNSDADTSQAERAVNQTPSAVYVLLLDTLGDHTRLYMDLAVLVSSCIRGLLRHPFLNTEL